MNIGPDFIRSRTARHRRLPEIGDGGAARLADARVAVVGAGGLGSTVIPYLAAAGVGRIDVFDDDVVELSNLNRQILHSVERIGQPKVDSAIAAGQRIAPEVEVVAHRVRLDENFAEVVGPVRPDVVIDGSDSFDTRFIVDAGAAELGVPVVFGALMQWSAQVTIFDAAGAYGPAIRLTDIFPDTAQVRATPGCAEMGILGSVAGMVGTMLATEAIKLLLGVGKTLLGRMLVIDTLDMTTTEIPLAPPEAVETIRVRAVTPQVLDATTTVVDVRRDDEVAEFPAPLVTVHVPFDQLESFKPVAGQRIVTLCRTGPRSVRAAQRLAASGHEVVGYLDGGVQALNTTAVTSETSLR
ncbi:HesA/MoeB/ThiF family protein [Enteractinococcus helveticum]|uniref:Rhodanese domain-containing protein n=1 Tax=Enteractinococcus helveticum TaxID=1837282 RepID=A0A1B7LXM8_9MICC|nr:HesA/MoeB/ThiF family protein [Enteractinococcus helveticum]OAV59936.1 hypothetical protein A6F49_14425 [Enteractinococcus helveticum]